MSTLTNERDERDCLHEVNKLKAPKHFKEKYTACKDKQSFAEHPVKDGAAWSWVRES